MMVALLLYAYSTGVRSARGIERHCRENVAFRVICANQVPDHATIARFRARHEQALSDLFSGVLSLCARAGLVKVGIVAIDGTKIAAAATHHATRSYEQIAKEIVEEAGRIDAAEDALYGEARGDELPEGLRTTGDRRKWLREAKQALEAERAAKAKPIPRSRGERLADCQRRLEEDWDLERRVVAEHAAWHARGIASDGSRRMVGARTNIKPYPVTEKPAGKLNVTDPDSRNLKTTRGWVQGYNAQAAVTPQQVVVAAEISTESLDTANLQPMVETACRELDGSRGGFCDYRARRIVVEDRQAPNAKVRVAVHELAHALGATSERFGRERAEVIVECAAFIVCSGLGLPTDGESVPYLAGWGESGALEAITEAAELIDEIADRIEKAAGLHNSPTDGERAQPVGA